MSFTASKCAPCGKIRTTASRLARRFLIATFVGTVIGYFFKRIGL
jgi:F0F1-type ATP synthase assembly protein I